MTRSPRVGIAGQALHLVQRGNNRQAVCFSDEDYGRQCTIIGSGYFQAEVETMLKRRVMQDAHGGDRKSLEFRERSSDLTP